MKKDVPETPLPFWVQMLIAVGGMALVYIAYVYWAHWPSTQY